TTRVKRALEIDPDTELGPEEHVPVKRARVENLEREVWVDGRRGRALLGLAIGLGARYGFELCFCFWGFVLWFFLFVRFVFALVYGAICLLTPIPIHILRSSPLSKVPLVPRPSIFRKILIIVSSC